MILCDIVGAIVYVTRILLGYGFSPYLSTYYILMSMLLALAMCMPEGRGTPVFCPSDQDEMDVNF